MTAIGTLLVVALLGADDPPARDKPVDNEAWLNDKLAAGVTPETNAVVLIWKAFGPALEGGRRMPAEYFRRLGIPEPPKDGDYFVGLWEYARDNLELTPDDIAPLLEAQEPTRRRPWAAKDHPRIAEWLAANEKPLAVLVEATRRPAYYDPLVSSRNDAGESSGLIGVLRPSVRQTRELAYALTARAMLRAGEGRWDAAWADLLACHRFGRLVARGGTIMETLVGAAVDAGAGRADLAYLAAAGLSADQLRARLKDLRALPPLPPVADTVDLGERSMHLDCLGTVRRRGVGVLEAFSARAIPPADEAEVRALARVDWGPAVADGNRWYDRVVAAMRLPDRASRSEALGRIEAEVEKLKKEAGGLNDLAKLRPRPDAPPGEAGRAIGHVLIGFRVPPLGIIQKFHDRAEQFQRNLYVAFALAAYRADHGKYPAKLADLSPNYLDPIPGDLFSGKALIYKPSADGYLFYSVGVNGTDDGGRLLTDALSGDDIGVRMPPEVPDEE